jgi:hypothetical protein
MKLGAENRTKTIIALALFVLGVFLVVRTFAGFGGAPARAAAPSPAAPATPRARRIIRARAPKPAEPSQPAVSLDPRLRLDLLKSSEDTDYTGTGRNIFRAEAETEIPSPVAPAVTPGKNGNPGPQTPAVIAPPPLPPIDLKFFGFASQPGQQKKVFLAKGDDVFVASEGDIVDRRYKIVKITNNAIEVLDVLNNNRQTIPLTSQG